MWNIALHMLLYFAANLGGTLGLCVGASALTVCEFIEFLIIAISTVIKPKNKYPSLVKIAPAKEVQY